jgi:hypothetical protein
MREYRFAFGSYDLPLGSIIALVVIAAAIMLLVRWSKSR